MRSTELFTLTVFVVAVGIAALAAEVFQMSVAMGAFFAGLVVGQSRIGPQAAADMVPFRDVFSALFFVSVGMLFNPQFVFPIRRWSSARSASCCFSSRSSALIIVAMLGGTLRTGLTVAVGLAQIGEFSFILAALAQSLGVLPAEGMDLLVATALVSIARESRCCSAGLEVDRAAPRCAPREEAEPARREQPAARTQARRPVAITGLGGIGRRLAQRCADSGLARVRDRQQPRCAGRDCAARHIATVYGDAGRQEVLKAAGVGAAQVIVVTNPSLPEKMGVCIAARAVNPRIAIIATADSAGRARMAGGIRRGIRVRRAGRHDGRAAAGDAQQPVTM